MEQEIWEELKCVYDPEIPVNIVDLGLIYSVELDEVEDNVFEVDIKMTLTNPACVMGPQIMAQAKDRVIAIPEVKDARIEIVWDPPWTKENISEAGKMELGLL